MPICGIWIPAARDEAVGFYCLRNPSLQSRGQREAPLWRTLPAGNESLPGNESLLGAEPIIQFQCSDGTSADPSTDGVCNIFQQ